MERKSQSSHSKQKLLHTHLKNDQSPLCFTLGLKNDTLEVSFTSQNSRKQSSTSNHKQNWIHPPAKTSKQRLNNCCPNSYSSNHIVFQVPENKVNFSINGTPITIESHNGKSKSAIIRGLPITAKSSQDLKDKSVSLKESPDIIYPAHDAKHKSQTITESHTDSKNARESHLSSDITIEENRNSLHDQNEVFAESEKLVNASNSEREELAKYVNALKKSVEDINGSIAQMDIDNHDIVLHPSSEMSSKEGHSNSLPETESCRLGKLESIENLLEEIKDPSQELDQQMKTIISIENILNAIKRPLQIIDQKERSSDTSYISENCAPVEKLMKKLADSMRKSKNLIESICLQDERLDSLSKQYIERVQDLQINQETVLKKFSQSLIVGNESKSVTSEDDLNSRDIMTAKKVSQPVLDDTSHNLSSVHERKKDNKNHLEYRKLQDFGTYKDRKSLEKDIDLTKSELDKLGNKLKNASRTKIKEYINYTTPNNENLKETSHHTTHNNENLKETSHHTTHNNENLKETSHHTTNNNENLKETSHHNNKSNRMHIRKELSSSVDSSEKIYCDVKHNCDKKGSECSGIAKNVGSGEYVYETIIKQTLKRLPTKPNLLKSEVEASLSDILKEVDKSMQQLLPSLHHKDTRIRNHKKIAEHSTSKVGDAASSMESQTRRNVNDSEFTSGQTTEHEDGKRHLQKKVTSTDRMKNQKDFSDRQVGKRRKENKNTLSSGASTHASSRALLEEDKPQIKAKSSHSDQQISFKRKHSSKPVNDDSMDNNYEAKSHESSTLSHYTRLPLEEVCDCKGPCTNPKHFSRSSSSILSAKVSEERFDHMTPIKCAYKGVCANKHHSYSATSKHALLAQSPKSFEGRSNINKSIEGHFSDRLLGSDSSDKSMEKYGSQNRSRLARHVSSMLEFDTSHLRNIRPVAESTRIDGENFENYSSEDNV